MNFVYVDSEYKSSNRFLPGDPLKVHNRPLIERKDGWPAPLREDPQIPSTAIASQPTDGCEPAPGLQAFWRTCNNFSNTRHLLSVVVASNRLAGMASSTAQHGNSSTTTLPPIRKPRGKYVSRACVECRARKLRCTGEHPCQRCMQRGNHCVFSVDRTLQEAVRSARQQMAPGSINGTPSLEARVQKLEQSLLTLTERLDSGDAPSPADEHDDEGFHGDSAMRNPIVRFNESLTVMKQQLGFGTSITSPSTSSRAHRASHASMPPLRREFSSGPTEIRIGTRTLPFPSPAQYNEYLDFFFEDINACHPCVNESDFRKRSEHMLATPQLGREMSCFLSLHYIIFACADILRHFTEADDENELASGLQWYHAADELVGR
jgi:hypothetical protein